MFSLHMHAKPSFAHRLQADIFLYAFDDLIIWRNVSHPPVLASCIEIYYFGNFYCRIFPYTILKKKH